MPGLVGIIEKEEGAINIKQLLPKMCEIIKYESWYKTDIFMNKNVGIGRVSLGILNAETQPIFNKDKNLCIMMEGEIYDYQDLKEDLILKGYSFIINNDVEFILHFYEEYKHEFPKKLKSLNGTFLFIIYDYISNELVICNDRYGLKPLYNYNHENYLIFSSEIKAILQDTNLRRGINPEAAAEFFSFGYVLGDKTLIEGIKLLPPGSIFIYNNSKSEIIRYWDWNTINKKEVIDERQIINELGRLWLQAVERRMQGNRKIGAFLSGGLDSRAIVSAINPQYFPIHTLTFGKKDCDDCIFAKGVCDKLGLKHHFVEMTAERWFSGIKRTVWITEGHLNVVHQHSWDAIDRMKELVDINLNGFAGDLIIGGSYLSDDFIKILNIEEYTNDVFKKMNEGNINSLDLSESLSAVARGSLDIEINKEIKMIEGSDYFFLNERVRRFTLLGTIALQTKIENRKPFYDNDFIEFVYSLPNEFRFDHYIYKKMLLKFFPQTFKEIPWQKTGVPIGSSKIKIKWHSLYRTFGSFTNKIMNNFNLSLKSKDNTNYTDYNNWMRENKEVKKYIFDTLLSEKSKSKCYFKPGFIEKLIEDHMSGKKDYAQILGLLLTFELFNMMFIDNY